MKPSKINLEQFNREFKTCFEAGWMKWVDDELIGITSDGHEVSLGSKYLNPINSKLYGLDEIKEYIIHNPTPNYW